MRLLKARFQTRDQFITAVGLRVEELRDDSSSAGGGAGAPSPFAASPLGAAAVISHA